MVDGFETSKIMKIMMNQISRSPRQVDVDYWKNKNNGFLYETLSFFNVIHKISFRNYNVNGEFLKV